MGICAFDMQLIACMRTYVLCEEAKLNSLVVGESRHETKPWATPSPSYHTPVIQYLVVLPQSRRREFDNNSKTNIILPNK